MSNVIKTQPEGGNAVALKPIDQIKHLLSSEAMSKQFRMALPSHIKVEMFTRNLMTALQENPQLADCTRDTLLKSAMTAAQLGLLVGSALGQAYIIPFRNQGKLEATFIPGYRGYLTLARNSGEVESMQAFEVCAHDEFDYQLGFDVKLHHKPAMGDRGAIKFVYCAVTFKDGGRHLEVMTSAEVEAIRARSKSPNSPAWQKDWMMMARKTVIRRTAKYLPLSVQRLAAMENEHEFGTSEPMNMGALGGPATIDGKVTPVAVDHGRLDSFETIDADTGEITDDSSTAHTPDAPQSDLAQSEPQDQQDSDTPSSDAGPVAGKDDDAALALFDRALAGVNAMGAHKEIVTKNQPWIDTLDGLDLADAQNVIAKHKARILSGGRR